MGGPEIGTAFNIYRVYLSVFYLQVPGCVCIILCKSMISLLSTGNNIVNVYCIRLSIPYIRNKLSFMHGRTFSGDRVCKVFLRRKSSFPKVLFWLDFFGGSSRKPTCQLKTIGYLSKMFGSSSVSNRLTTSVAYNVLALQCAIKCDSVNHNKPPRLWPSVAYLQYWKHTLYHFNT